MPYAQRLYFEHAKTGRGAHYEIAVRKHLLVTSAWLALIYLAVTVIGYAAGRTVYWNLAVPALLLLVLQTQLTGTFTFLEAERRYRSLTVAQSLFKILQVPCLIVLLQLTICAPTAIIGAQVVAVASVIALWGRRSRRVERSRVAAEGFTTKEVAQSAAASFGWSVYLMTAFSWLLSTSDRYVIDYFLSSGEVGVYSVNYGLWSMPYLMLNAALELTIRSRVFQRAETADWAGVRTLILARLTISVALGLIGTGLLYLIGPKVAALVIGVPYRRGTELMLLIAGAHAFYAAGISYYSVFVSAKRVAVMVPIMAAACVLNVVLNVLLISQLGIIGAAWSTLITFSAMGVFLLIAGERLLSALINQSRQQVA